SINVGFDLNNHNGNKIFYCIDPFATNLTWYNSTYNGSLMVRPIMASPTLVAGVNNIDAPPTNEITLYPNPAKNEVMLSGNLHNALVRLMGADGRVLYTDEHYSGNSINTSTLPNGFYLVQITSEKGETTFRKLLISR
ncbi:MAG TPA: T9SS type A sorting domain-containing protein, partial [Bacteroidia bacterium]|nr:T9SS type A sorting domain-containing protein [Bacteroidia bacterium]